ncbi:hypothetical protein JOD45_000705 [Scopulibacillus daqui]|uniref:Uncharacterized protein n=1 Tax=Scopulibacillus daqui TaxID=1469162 RepID=A0ABS2PYY3_9BACL|nr:hypothetical protein [Scopulibacillus daqui]
MKSKEDETQWLEISWYKDEECYAKSLSLINNHQDIQELFASFQAILASGKDEISEQEYDQIEEMSY